MKPIPSWISREKDKERQTIERIRMASEMPLSYYQKPLVCTYSGGKDSDVMLELFRRAGIPFKVLHSHTTMDAPPTVYYVREVFKRLREEGVKATIHMPEISMWQLIVKKKIPPTRRQRYCCEAFKEYTVRHRFVATGVRWQESRSRTNRREMEPVGDYSGAL